MKYKFKNIIFLNFRNYEIKNDLIWKLLIIKLKCEIIFDWVISTKRKNIEIILK